MLRKKLRVLFLLVVLVSCNNNRLQKPAIPMQNSDLADKPIKPPRKVVADCTIQQTVPTKLSETCFFTLVTSLEKGQQVYSNFFEFQPHYKGYSDGAEKRRWIYLPKGKQIDTQDLDNWIFPKGTILFKEFLIGDKKIETRILEKESDSAGVTAWRFSNYAWTKDQIDAELVTNVFYEQSPEIRSRFSAAEVEAQFKMSLPKTCVACHSGATDVVNGFNYLQLSSNMIDFNILQAGDAGILSAPPKIFDSIKGNNLDRKAIGYIQVNCAICHSPTGPGDGDFRHSHLSMSLETEVFMETASGAELINKGDPDSSYLIKMFESGRMPRVKPVTQDAKGIALIRKWILTL